MFKQSMINEMESIKGCQVVQLHPDKVEGGAKRRGVSSTTADPGNPLVTVITVVRNAEKALEKTISSVLNQTYENIEYIIIDGGSTDGTLDIIRKYDDRVDYWLSEPDQGISDAFNKGVRASSGEFIGLLNADDWLSQDQVEQGVKALQASSADYVFGDLLLHDEEGRILYRIKGDPDYARLIHSKMPELNHPTVLARKKAYQRIGLFDTNYRYAMDYEWLLRLHAQGGTGMYVKEISAHMGLGGASDSFYRKALKEVRNIAVRYGQNRFRAEISYRYRVVKGWGRRRSEKWAPKLLFDSLRNLFNPRYSPLK